MVAVVVPFRGGCPHRERAWRWVRERYAGAFPDWRVVEAEAPPGIWNKAAAVNPAIEAIEAEIVVLADADVWTEGLALAVGAVMQGEAWSVPHGFVHRITEQGTAAILAGGRWETQELEESLSWGFEGGGIIVARKEALLAAPMDRRFIGWGQEDECHAMALRTLFGAPWRGSTALVHLWHPPQQRLSRRRGSKESWALRSRYLALRENPAGMTALIEEARGVAD